MHWNPNNLMDGQCCKNYLQMVLNGQMINVTSMKNLLKVMMKTMTTDT